MPDGWSLWMLHSVILGGLVFLVALVLEPVLRALGRPTRWLWCAGLAAATLLPATTMIGEDSGMGPVFFGGASTLSNSSMISLNEAAAPGSLKALAHLGELLLWLWLLASIAILGYTVLGIVLLLRRSRHWTIESVAGDRVFVSTAEGPASFALLRPAIIVPRWIRRLAPEEQQIIIAHERSHVEHRDSWLLLAAIVSTILLPWNLAIHLMRPRLRAAIEADCDQRVVRSGVDARRYGALLVDLQRKITPSRGLALGWTAGSPLERRLRDLYASPRRSCGPRGLLNLGGASLVALTGLWLPGPTPLISMQGIGRSAAVASTAKTLSCEGRDRGPRAAVLDLREVADPNGLSLVVRNDLSRSRKTMLRLSAPDRNVFAWCDGASVTLTLLGEWAPQEIGIELTKDVALLVRTNDGMAGPDPASDEARCTIREGRARCTPEAEQPR